MSEESKAVAAVAEKETKKKEKGVPFGKLMAWSLRGGSTGIAMMIFGYLTVFAVNTMKMDPKLIGTLLLVSKLIDGVTDLFAGYIVDKTKTKWGKGRPYEWCVVGMWLCTVLVPAAANNVVKSIWVLLMYLFANSIFYTFLNANHTVYMVRAFKTQKEYVQLSTYGGVVPMLMTVIFNIAFPMMMKAMATTQAGWIKLVLIFAVPLTLLGMLRFFVIKETNDVDVKAAGQKVEFKDVLLVLKKNPYIYILSLGVLVMNLHPGRHPDHYPPADVCLPPDSQKDLRHEAYPHRSALHHDRLRHQLLRRWKRSSADCGQPAHRRRCGSDLHAGEPPDH